MIQDVHDVISVMKMAGRVSNVISESFDYINDNREKLNHLYKTYHKTKWTHLDEKLRLIFTINKLKLTINKEMIANRKTIDLYISLADEAYLTDYTDWFFQIDGSRPVYVRLRNNYTCSIRPSLLRIKEAPLL